MRNEEKFCDEKRCREVIARPWWGEGPWNHEPDRVDFRWHGLDCFVHRNSGNGRDWEGTGSWCGYVGVSRKHPAFGHGYDEVNVDVHGGLTFAEKCHPHGHLCHVGGVVWWLGFDCAHAFDLSPAMQAHMKKFDELIGRDVSALHETYRDLPYVMKETRHLAFQLAHFTGHQLRPRYDGLGNARDPRRNRERFFRRSKQWTRP